jgi:hypothetical protein
LLWSMNSIAESARNCSNIVKSAASSASRTNAVDAAMVVPLNGWV